MSSVSVEIAEHRGVSAAVIAGDLALFNAYRLIDKSGVGSPLRERLLDVLDEAMFASAAGELIDVDFSIDAPFPLKDPRINIGQVSGGKLKNVATSVTVPKLNKW